MIYANDSWIQLPTVDLYDTQMMLASVQAAKDMYEKGQQQIKDFEKQYGDFYTLIPKDAERYSKMMNDIRGGINNLYAQGIDPLRSAEGRAAVSQLIRSIPTDLMPKLKASAAAAEQYVKAKGALDAAGRYDPDFEERFLGYDLNKWDTYNNGVWNRYSPIESKSLKELTESSYNNRTPHQLTQQEVLSFPGAQYDPRAIYRGFTYNDLLGIANTVAPGLTGTIYSDYYRDLARRQLIAKNIEPTYNNITAQLAKNIADSQKEWMVKPEADYDIYYKDQDLRIKRASAAASANAANARARYYNQKAQQEQQNQTNSWTTRQQYQSLNKRDKYKSTASTFDQWVKQHQTATRFTIKDKNGKERTIQTTVTNLPKQAADKNFKQLVQSYYNTWESKPEGADQEVAKAVFSGYNTSNTETLLDGSKKSTSVDFGVSTDLRLRSIAETQWAGRKYTKNSISIKFNDYLNTNHISGERVGEVTVNYKPTRRGTDLYEFNGYVRVPKESLEDFLKNYDDPKGIVERLGLVEKTQTRKQDVGSGLLSSKAKYVKRTYYDIPVSRRIDADGFTNNVIDKLDDILNTTKSVAAKREDSRTGVNSSWNNNYGVAGDDELDDYED